jgi:hypothetical protein
MPRWLDIVWWVALVTNLVATIVTCWRYWQHRNEWKSIASDTAAVVAENAALRVLLEQLGVQVTVTREQEGLRVDAIQRQPPDSPLRLQ